jgi:hypothetical protein
MLTTSLLNRVKQLIMSTHSLYNLTPKASPAEIKYAVLHYLLTAGGKNIEQIMEAVYPFRDNDKTKAIVMRYSTNGNLSDDRFKELYVLPLLREGIINESENKLFEIRNNSDMQNKMLFDRTRYMENEMEKLQKSLQVTMEKCNTTEKLNREYLRRIGELNVLAERCTLLQEKNNELQDAYDKSVQEVLETNGTVEMMKDIIAESRKQISGLENTLETQRMTTNEILESFGKGGFDK